MAHKGRPYPYRQQLRGYNHDVDPPQLWGDKYVATVEIWQGALGSLTPTGDFLCEFKGFEANRRAFRFEGHVGDPLGLPVEIGFYFEIDFEQVPYYSFAYLWVNGVDQYDEGNRQLFPLLQWGTGDTNFNNQNPVLGAILWGQFGLSYHAQLW